MGLHNVQALCLLIFFLAKGDGLRCYSCSLVGDPQACHNTTRCEAGKICVVTETIDDAFNLNFRLGCVAEQDCISTVRRSSDVKRSLKEQCCRENLCNRGYPGTLTTRPTTTKPTVAPTSSHVTTTHQHHSPLAQSQSHSTTPSHQPIDISNRCPHGHSLDGYCYVPSLKYGQQSSKVSRQDADKFCRSHQMMLPSIHSQDENNFLHRLMEGNTFWLGLDDVHWNDGTAFNFNMWNSDNYHNTHNKTCVVMDSSNEWKAESCHLHHYFVCRRKLQLPS
uniref:Uncharacterized protein LOC111104665 n=1 Tax=Crassostrea virginica TaxID=6565 RepID=A0A8B8AUT3_CRAVI|nr:uncharacterized protein LOC111104665 [Crassostrea virginica]